jgi:hypothetical protein
MFRRERFGAPGWFCIPALKARLPKSNKVSLGLQLPEYSN